MEDQVSRFWQDLGGRVGGPMTLRLLLQPAMAAFFAIRAGRSDAASGQPPYAWALFTNPSHRREMMANGWKDIVKVFVAAILMDGVYQLMVFRWFYPVEALVVAFVLACVPYLAVRGPVNLIARGHPGRTSIRQPR